MKKCIKNIVFSLFILSFLCVTQLSGMHSRLFPKYLDFFKEITGMSERNFSNLPIDKKLAFYKDKIEGQGRAGVYRPYSIKYLRAKEKENEPFRSYGFFKIMPETTVQDLMGNIGFKYAVFQSASNVNTLEGGRGKKSSLLINMQKRAVQGETVKACAALCDVENKYFPCYIKYKKIRPINLLSGISQRMGAPAFKVSKTGRIEGIPNHLTQDDYKKICIGYRRDTKVFYKADREHKYKHKNGLEVPMLKRIEESPYEPSILVDIAMSFAIDLNPNHIGRWQYNVYDKNVRNVAKQIVKATYEATIRSAFHNNRQKIVLTTVGTGAFQNPIEWAIDAIRNMKDFIVKKNMQVFLVIPSKTYSHKIDVLAKEFAKAFSKQKEHEPVNYGY